METVPQTQQPLSTKTDSKRIYIVAIIVVIVAGLLTYFLYWKKTPEYSLGIIRDAITTHNVATFQRHVDLDTLLSRAFDDVVLGGLEKEGNDVKSMAAGFAQAFKQPTVSALKDGVKRYVESGSFEVNNQPTTDAQASASTDKISPKDFSKKSGLTSADYRGVAYTKKDGKIAVVGIKIWEKQVAKEFVLDVKMRELDDGTWQIAEVSNLSAYVSLLEQAREQKLAELNKPTEDQIKSAVTVGEATSQKVAGDRWGFSTLLQVTIPLTFNEDKNITELAGTMIVISEDKQIFKGTFDSQGSTYKGKVSYLKRSWELNPFIEGQKKIIRIPDNSLVKKVTIRRLKFSDGSELKLLDKLPD